jgi:hypothetical protein
VSKILKIFIIVIIAALVAAAGFYLSKKENKELPQQNVWETGKEGESAAYDLSSLSAKKFTDAKRGFSFSYPESLSASTFSDGAGGEVILVQSAEKAQGFQIVISSFDEQGTTLTREMIQKDIPGLDIRDVQDLLLGESGRGVAFLSDNSSFGGNSREVWFVYSGHLYQISTYARLDPLLQAVLGTWKFE